MSTSKPADSVLADLLGDDRDWADIAEEEEAALNAELSADEELAAELGMSVEELNRRTAPKAKSAVSAAAVASGRISSQQPASKKARGAAAAVPAPTSAHHAAQYSSYNAAASPGSGGAASAGAAAAADTAQHSRLAGHKRARAGSAGSSSSTEGGGAGSGSGSGRGRGGGSSLPPGVTRDPKTLEDTVALLSYALNEFGPQQVLSLRNTVIQLSIDTCLALLDRAEAVQASGGMPTADGARRRTAGGVFFHLVKEAATKEQYKKIFEHVTAKHQKALQEKRKRRASLAGGGAGAGAGGGAGAGSAIMADVLEQELLAGAASSAGAAMT